MIINMKLSIKVVMCTQVRVLSGIINSTGMGRANWRIHCINRATTATGYRIGEKGRAHLKKGNPHLWALSKMIKRSKVF